jgi:hypothetical protein
MGTPDPSAATCEPAHPLACGSDATVRDNCLWTARNASDRSRFEDEHDAPIQSGLTHVRPTSRLRPLSSRAPRRAHVLSPVPGRCAPVALGGRLTLQAYKKTPRPPVSRSHPMTAQAVSSGDALRRFEPGGRGVVFVQGIVPFGRRGIDWTLPLRSSVRSGRGPWHPPSRHTRKARP